MLIYLNILQKLDKAGYPYSYLRSRKVLSESTMQSIRMNKPILAITIETICTLLKCQPNDIIRNVRLSDLLSKRLELADNEERKEILKRIILAVNNEDNKRK